jgi:DNA-binding Lrp family transcriptional regulator
MTIDAIDEKLIAAMKDNGRASTADLARRVGRSRTTVQSRIERLERDGVILGYAARLAPDHAHGAVRVHVMIKIGPKEARAVEAALRGHSPGAAAALGQRRFRHDRRRRHRDGRPDGRGARPHRPPCFRGVERTTSSIILSTKFEGEAVLARLSAEWRAMNETLGNLI